MHVAPGAHGCVAEQALSQVPVVLLQPKGKQLVCVEYEPAGSSNVSRLAASPTHVSVTLKGALNTRPVGGGFVAALAAPSTASTRGNAIRIRPSRFDNGSPAIFESFRT
jgi:hypothetical protein